MSNKITPLFLDCESVGLRGEVFSAALIDPDGEVLFNMFYDHPELQTNEWLKENVLPHLFDQATMVLGLEIFETQFSECYRLCKEKYGWEPWGPGFNKSLAIVTSMGCPVEANLFQQIYKNSLRVCADGSIDSKLGINEFYGPYPLLDTAPLLLKAGYDPTSEEAFAKAVGIELPKDFKPHSAVSDAQLTRLVWNYLMNNL